MAEELWVVRAGERARYAEDFQNGEYIAVGFMDFFPDDLDGTSEIQLRQRATSPAERTFASQLSAFAYRLDIGDYVIVPLLPRRQSYLVSQVTGPYRHIASAPTSGPHRRAVKWLGEFPREGLSTGATNTLGAIQTIFRPTAAEAELRAQIAGLPPIDRPEPEGANHGSSPRPARTRGRIADRLNLGGARWRLDGAEAILTLRAVISNGDFEEYWRFHLEREHQRLYPGTVQGQYALGA